MNPREGSAQGPRPSLLERAGLCAGRLVLGRAFTSTLAGLKREQWRTRAELESLQERMLLWILRHAAARVPFYRARIDPDGLKGRDDLVRFPVADKALFRSRPIEEFLAEGVDPARREPYTTSGSTGDPFAFYLDRRANPVVFASHLFFDSWFGLGPFDRGVRVMAPPATDAPLGSGSLRFRMRERASRAIKRAYERWTERRFSMFEVSEDDAGRVLDEIDRFRPAYLMGYASSLALLASAAIRGGRSLQSPPRVVIPIAEPLTEDRRDLLARAFTPRIANRYGQREFKYWVAQSCGEDPSRFHLVTSLAFAEVLREDGSRCDPGEVGRLVLTHLYNQVMPFVRYDTGDLAALDDDPCPCGRGYPILRSLEGRSAEVLATSGGGVVSPVSLGHYLFVVKGHAGAVRGYQLVRTRDGSVRLDVVPEGDAGADLDRRLLHDLRALLGPDTLCSVRLVREIPLERSGKRPIIKIER